MSLIEELKETLKEVLHKEFDGRTPPVRAVRELTLALDEVLKDERYTVRYVLRGYIMPYKFTYKGANKFRIATNHPDTFIRILHDHFKTIEDDDVTRQDFWDFGKVRLEKDELECILEAPIYDFLMALKYVAPQWGGGSDMWDERNGYSTYTFLDTTWDIHPSPLAKSPETDPETFDPETVEILNEFYEHWYSKKSETDGK